MSGRPPFVDQTILYNPAEGSTKGNCTEAAVASILGLRLENVPDFRADGDDAVTFWDAFHEFFRERGYEAIRMGGNFCPEVMYLALGISPRGAHHMVVMQDGKLLHDPHPSKAGIGDPDHTWLIVPIDPAVRHA
ncbi:hypothetical protein GCM10011491_30850 [Brucella endophytica]|uniref:Uncharacterized protein n=1 Tax=Brucella endophytica TaxID=1963359 RepID=A0A916WIG8_9HYPH|nr:hypothetical protein [Brucella endophytica]GGB00479.1 hypothetical protein GCM10011491_30850 [Brucella endophytica]